MTGWRCILVLILAGGLSAVLRAADPPQRADHFQDMSSELLRELDRSLQLTDSQKERIVVLKRRFEEQHHDELQSLRSQVMDVNRAIALARRGKDPTAQRSAREKARGLRQHAEKLRSEFEGELLGILDAGQRRQYEHLKKELSKPGRLRPGKRPPKKSSGAGKPLSAI